MADRIFDPDEPTHAPTAQDFDGGWHSFGNRAPISEACDLVGGSVWIANPEPANLRWLVYQVSDESIVAEVDVAALTGTTPGAWNDFTSADFADPGDVALDPDEEYFVVYATNGDFVFRDSGVSFPYGTGIVAATEAAFFNGGTGPEFPDSFSTGFLFPADMIVEAGGDAPVAVTGLVPAAAISTSTAKKIAVAVSRSLAAATASAAATKVAKAAGNAAAVAASTSTAHKSSPAAGIAAGTPASTSAAVKIARVTAICSAVAASSSAAATVRPVSSTSTGAAASIAGAAKRASVGGATYAVATSHKAGADVRPVSATCYAIATSTARYRRVIRRPNTGTITRPNTGVILRP